MRRFPNTVAINGFRRKVRYLQTDPVNNEHIIQVDSVLEDEIISDEEEDLNPCFSNSAKEYPKNAICVTLDPISGSYRIIPKPEMEYSESEVVSIVSEFSDNEAENGNRRRRSFNKQIYLTAKKIDARLNAFRDELDTQLVTLLEEDENRTDWQEHVDDILTLFAKDLETNYA